MTENQLGDANLPTEASRDTMKVSRAFGEAYQADGATIIPVAKVMGGSGMGYGSGGGGDRHGDGGPHAEGSGGGGGYGTRVKPLGVYSVRDGKVTWQPAIDVNRAIIGGQVVMAVFIVAFACLRRVRHKARRWDYLAARSSRRR
ncbi:MAG TPA: spore germination protein GerW family protein [Beutenbergiaceae bacterium]|nr:spore germination protein GerW family protein [Beutenbergiaceae bacterium]